MYFHHTIASVARYKRIKVYVGDQFLASKTSIFFAGELTGEFYQDQ